MNLTFLNPIFLAGLAAAAIPIVIHLLQRRRLKRIEFSDLRFLAPLNQQRMRSMNLRRWLLLLLRVLIVALTAVAMARPSLRGALTSLVPTQARSSVLLLVDTSYSMRAEDENGTALDHARDAAERLLAALQPGDAVDLMTFDAHPRAWFRTPVHDFAAVRERLDALQPSWRATNWPEALDTALQALDRATEPNRELYVFSDFAGVLPESLDIDLSALQKDVRVTFVPVRVEPFVNVSIEDVQVPPGAILKDDPVRIGVAVRNHAPDVPADCVLRVELGGEPKGEASLRLGRGAQLTQDFTLVATAARELAGVVSKRVDRLPVDDVHHFVLPVLSRLEVLHVRGTSGLGGAFFISRALEPTSEGRSPIHLREVTAERFASADLEGKQVVVVSSGALLTESQAQILATFVREGGGLCLFTGRRETADVFNRLLQHLGNARVRGVVQRDEGYLNLVDLRPSGILAGFEPEELRTLENVQFTRYAELAAGAGGRVVLRFAGGDPALVEATSGSGKVMVYGFDAATDGSDLALSTMFLPLLHRAVVYLAGETGRQKLDHHVGDRIEVQVPLGGAHERAATGSPEWRERASGPPAPRVGVADARLAQAGRSDGGAVPAAGGDAATTAREDAAPDPPDEGRAFKVTTPSGRTEVVEARFVGKLAIASFEATEEPGAYVFEGLGQRLVRAVNVDTRESDLTPLDTAQLASALHLKTDLLENPVGFARHLREARHGKELWKLLVAVVLVLLVLELWISRAASTHPADAS